ncbi:MAG TPA: 3-methyl-2-oxobutanoate hydroxymethyltransferase [bacterium]|nr:3-methyl-2-oxobutanoate hydroxymethyltransferase [bacterium]
MTAKAPQVRPAKIRTSTLLAMKKAGERICVVTAYDYPSALALEAAEVEVCLVGDSLGQVVLGYESTIPVTLDEMAHHAKAVKRGLKRALLVVDLPFLSYQSGPQQALASAGRLMKEAGAEAVKLEGGAELGPSVRLLRQAGVAVMGHLGLTPQSVHAMGGYKIQAREPKAAAKLLADAKALQAAGAFSLVLEGVPGALARKVSRALAIPTIGIGAGAGCDGQVQVWHDLHGALPGRPPRHAKAFGGQFEAQVRSLKAYAQAVRAGSFPGPEQTPA